jgi:hypothetical protein
LQVETSDTTFALVQCLWLEVSHVVQDLAFIADG